MKRKHLHRKPAAVATALARSIAGLQPRPFEHKAEMLELCRSWLVKERAQLKQDFLATGHVVGLLTRHTGVVDTLLRTLFEAIPEEERSGVCIVAAGGYGRSELFPYSDIDIVFLYDEKAEENAARVAESLLYVLWDLGFKVGQSHRTVGEAITRARDDITIRTTLLDARLVVGDAAFFHDFQKRFDAELIQGRELEFVEAKLSERDTRHHRFGDSRYMLEPNVKDGKGGLRDAHTLWWLARAAYPLESMAGLVQRGQMSRTEFKAFEQARLFLCNVRAHLHYITGGPQERLTFDHQHALAVVMGFESTSINRSIERFMRRYFAAARTVGTTTRIICALLEDEKKRKPRASLSRLWHMPWNLNGYKVDGQRLNVRFDNAFEKNPIMMIELFRQAQIHGLDIHPNALTLVSRNLKRIDAELQNDPRANALLMDIMLYHKGAEATLRRMSEAGVLGKFIPDFGRVVGQTQFNMYHVYTVDEHTLVAIGMLHAMENGTMKEELPLASELIHRIRLKHVLYLALFCHDIAKGRNGDHSILGEKIAEKLAIRFGFTPDEVETTAWLVRHHLLFSNTAFKRDFNDPKTVQDFVAQLQSPERLKLLLVLTVADIRAVSPNVWNAWKGVLMRELYTRAEHAMGTGEVVIKQQQVHWFREDLKRALTGWSDAQIDDYLGQGTASFWASIEPDRHIAIARMVREAQRAEQPVLIDTHHDYERSITEVTVCTHDRPALFSMIAGAMSLAGANIINAKIYTLKNGVAVEIFQLQDLAGDVFDRPDRLAKMSVYIEQVIGEELDLSHEFASRASGYLKSRKNAVPLPAQVLIDNDASNIHSVIEVTGRDRSGILHEVTRTMAELGLSIATAHISTYGNQIADVFYVKDNFGMKISHETKIKKVRSSLLVVMSG
jgi:[protein-PII] uridylyltransferase